MARKRRRLDDIDSAYPLDGETIDFGDNVLAYIFGYFSGGVFILISLGLLLTSLDRFRGVDPRGVIFAFLFGLVGVSVFVTTIMAQSYKYMLCDDCIQVIRLGYRVVAQIPFDNIDNVILTEYFNLNAFDRFMGVENYDIIAFRLKDPDADDTWWPSFLNHPSRSCDLCFMFKNKIIAERNYRKIMNEVIEDQRFYAKQPNLGRLESEFRGDTVKPKKSKRRNRSRYEDE